MEFIRGDKELAIRTLSDRLVFELIHGKKVLWIVPGGSNITLASSALATVREKVPKELANLSIVLSDERFGPVAHGDSNWQGLIEAGFDLSLAKGYPVLRGLPLDETISGYEKDFGHLCKESDIVIGQFGIGADSHIAGILPYSPAVDSPALVEAYDAPRFKRVTLTLKALLRVDAAYAFAFGESKREAIAGLRDTSADVAKKPAAILHQIKEAFVISDQVE